MSSIYLSKLSSVIIKIVLSHTENLVYRLGYDLGCILMDLFWDSDLKCIWHDRWKLFIMYFIALRLVHPDISTFARAALFHRIFWGPECWSSCSPRISRGLWTSMTSVTAFGGSLGGCFMTLLGDHLMSVPWPVGKENHWRHPDAHTPHPLRRGTLDCYNSFSDKTHLP